MPPSKKIVVLLAALSALLSPFSLLAADPAPTPAAPAAAATMSKEQEVEIHRLLELTGMTKMVDQMVQQTFDQFQSQSHDVPAEFWVQMKQEFKAADLVARLMPLYAKYYSAEDIHAINEFYSSPTGQRLLQKMPLIMNDSVAIGQQWGQELAQKVIARMQAAQAAAAPAAPASTPAPAAAPAPQH